MVIYYLLAAILAAVNLIIFVVIMDGRKVSYYFLTICAIMAIANFGYYTISVSSSLETMILANKLSYMGGCFLPPVLMCCICMLCNINISRRLKAVLYGFSAIVYALVLTTGRFSIYYKSAKMDRLWDAAVLSTEKTGLYSLFYAILYGYIVADIGLLLYAFVKKDAVSRKTLWTIACIEIITIMSFIIGRSVNPDFEVMPAVYVMDGWLFFVLRRSFVKYNISENIFISMSENKEVGYVMFDSKRRFLGANEAAQKSIPELANCHVDEMLTQENQPTFLYDWIDRFIKGKTGANEREYEDEFYDCYVKEMKRGRKNIGYVIDIRNHTDRHKYMNLLSEYNGMLERQVQSQTKHILEIQNKIIMGMANIVEDRDSNTGGHIKRTSDVIKVLIDTINENKIFDLSPQFCADVIKAAPMHDLGKIGVADAILCKPGRLTDEEFAQMKTHSNKSAEICEKILRGVEEEHFVDVAVNIARYHHEKWNGFGYPHGLKEENIPLEARIMAVADVYDALVSKRCYKEAMTFEEANKVMLESMGSHFDPKMEQVFILSREKLEEYYKESNKCTA